MKITNNIGLQLEGKMNSYLWVVPFWLEGKSFLQVVVNGEPGLQVSIDDADRSCNMSWADGNLNESERNAIITRINELLAQENIETVLEDRPTPKPRRKPIPTR